MIIRPVRAELFHVDTQMDRHDEAYSRFSLFCERALKQGEIGKKGKAAQSRNEGTESE